MYIWWGTRPNWVEFQRSFCESGEGVKLLSAFYDTPLLRMRTPVLTEALTGRLLRTLPRSTSFEGHSKSPSKKRIVAWPPSCALYGIFLRPSSESLSWEFRSFSFHLFYLSFLFKFSPLFGKQALKTPKPALKQPNRHFKKKKSKRLKPALRGPNRHLSEALGELCL